MVYFHTTFENYYSVCIILKGCMKIGHGIYCVSFKRKWKLLRRKVSGLKCVIFHNNGPKIWKRWKVDTTYFISLLTYKYITSDIIY